MQTRTKNLLLMVLLTCGWCRLPQALAQQAGSIQIVCDPRAEILLDGRPCGRPTHTLSGEELTGPVDKGTKPDAQAMLILQGVSPGSHVVKASVTEHGDQTRNVQVQAGLTAVVKFAPFLKVKAELPPAMTKTEVGVITIKTQPVECIVDIHSLGLVGYNKKNSQRQEIFVMGAPVGKHPMVFSLQGQAGGKTVPYELDLQAGQWVTLTVNLLDGTVKREVLQGRPMIQVTVGDFSMLFVEIPPGSFTMGSVRKDLNVFCTGGGPQETTIAQPFYLGVTEVTEEQFGYLMRSRRSGTSRGANMPVVVDMDEAEKFCQELSQRTGGTCRLPSEAQWEYACRAGTTTDFSTGNTLAKDQACFGEREPREVASFSPNPWGLCDMHGNVAELCLESASRAPQAQPSSNPRARRGGAPRISLWRGGSCASKDPIECASWYRGGGPTNQSYALIGFRVVLAIGADTGPGAVSAPTLQDHRELLQAAGEGNAQRVRQLLAKGCKATFHDPNTHQSPLMAAVAKGHLEVVTILAENGADINAPNMEGGCPPLIMAAYQGHTKVVEYLVGRPGCNLLVRDRQKCTALHWAAIQGHKDVATVLVDPMASASVNAGNAAPRVEPFMGPGFKGKPANMRDAKTPAKAAVAFPMGLPAYNGASPLAYALYFEHPEVAKIFIDRGLFAKASGSIGITALHYAALKGYKDLAEMLIREGAQTNAMTKYRHTPVDFAKMGGHGDIVDLLTAKGAKAGGRGRPGPGRPNPEPVPPEYWRLEFTPLTE
jgi:formylglycine-generating enzyme required for sulfatase activity/ankyrin repeat protein